MERVVNKSVDNLPESCFLCPILKFARREELFVFFLKIWDFLDVEYTDNCMASTYAQSKAPVRKTGTQGAFKKSAPLVTALTWVVIAPVPLIARRKAICRSTSVASP